MHSQHTERLATGSIGPILPILKGRLARGISHDVPVNFNSTTIVSIILSLRLEDVSAHFSTRDAVKRAGSTVGTSDGTLHVS